MLCKKELSALAAARRCCSLQRHPALRCKSGLLRTAPCRNMLFSFARWGAESLAGCPPTAPTPNPRTSTPHPHPFVHEAGTALTTTGILYGGMRLSGVADVVAVGAALAVPINWAVRLDAKLAALDTKLDTKLGKLDTKLGKLDTKLDVLGAQIATLDSKLGVQIATLDAKLTKVDMLLYGLAGIALVELGLL